MWFSLVIQNCLVSSDRDTLSCYKYGAFDRYLLAIVMSDHAGKLVDSQYDLHCV
jgi:hypothetical protein